MNSEKNLRVSVLLDYYAPMLTEKQKDVIDLYYNEDLSLSEIAEHESITRQGVRDSIKRGEQTLFDMEEKFHLAERSEKFSELTEHILAIAKDIKSEMFKGQGTEYRGRKAEDIFNFFGKCGFYGVRGSVRKIKRRFQAP